MLLLEMLKEPNMMAAMNLKKAGDRQPGKKVKDILV